jgi:hypothetical protein
MDVGKFRLLFMGAKIHFFRANSLSAEENIYIYIYMYRVDNDPFPLQR